MTTDNIIIIPLTKGQQTIIDIEDADLAELKWFANKTKGRNKKEYGYYATRKIRLDHKHKTIQLHCVIMERILGRPLCKGELCDHKNLNKLDNRRENLRIASRTLNTINSPVRSDNKSGYKGVSYYKSLNKYVAKISIGGKQKCLGYRDTAEEAYALYCAAAIEHYGEYARLE